MRGVIKGVLKEELQNSMRMKKEYEQALKNLPQGCLAVKKIRGHKYYYLVRRIGKKVKYIYKGKISEEERKKYLEAKQLRAKYRKLLSQVKKQIRFLRSSLRGKEAV
jgi:ABC-type phosphate transport system auxiliary subunit